VHLENGPILAHAQDGRWWEDLNMSNEAAASAKDPKDRDEAPSAQGSLTLLYDVILTSVVRLQASRQHIPDVESFRRRIKGTLQEIEHAAVSAGYDAHDIRDTHFAVVAFLDSVVLHSKDPVRKEWERKLLQEELFAQTDAGVVFFEKLAQFQSRRDSEQLANILEVYLLCLLLGFEGRFSGGMRAELDSIMQRARNRIENIRGRGRQISPGGDWTGDSAPLELAQNQKLDRFRLIVFAEVAFTVLCFLAFKVHLIWTAERLGSQLP
jgi:type VI secretion system protein ImpK